MQTKGRQVMAKDDKERLNRRAFLGALGAGAGAAAGAGTFTTAARADSETNAEKVKARYRETEHVKTFYRVNRYPAKR
jgi:hypothetical protein